MELFKCDCCNYQTYLKGNLNIHNTSQKHKNAVLNPLPIDHKQIFSQQDIKGHCPLGTPPTTSGIVDITTNEHLFSILTRLEGEVNEFKQLLIKGHCPLETPTTSGIVNKTENMVLHVNQGGHKRNCMNPIKYLNKERSNYYNYDNKYVTDERFIIDEEDDLLNVLNKGFVSTLITIVKRRGMDVIPFASANDRKRIIYVKTIRGWEIDTGNECIKDFIDRISRLIIRKASIEWTENHPDIKSIYDGETANTRGVAIELSMICMGWNQEDSKIAPPNNCEREAIKAMCNLFCIDHLLEED